MAFDKTDIINRALVKLGSRPITNLEDDNTDESITALNLYDIALESLLSETLWTFATRRKLLATLGGTEGTPVFSKDNEDLSIVYQRPNDVIRIFDTNDTAAYYKEEGDTIVSDTNGLGIIYTFRNEDASTYSPHFVRALSDLLISDMAYALLNSNSTAEASLEKYEKITLPKAKAENAQIGTAKELNDNYWLNARFGGPNVKELS